MTRPDRAVVDHRAWPGRTLALLALVAGCSHSLSAEAPADADADGGATPPADAGPAAEAQPGTHLAADAQRSGLDAATAPPPDAAKANDGPDDRDSRLAGKLEITLDEMSVAGCAGETRAFNATIVNVGASTVGPVALALAGDHRDDFAIAPSGCSGATLIAGAKCTVGLSFAPLPRPVPGRMAELVASAATGERATAPLFGQASSAARGSLSPHPYYFGQVFIGSARLEVFQYTHHGASPTTVHTVVLRGADARDFRISRDECSGVPVPPGRSCALEIAFSPGSCAGRKRADLEVSATGGCVGGTATATLWGDGHYGAPGLYMDPQMHQFPRAKVGSAGARMVFVLERAGLYCADSFAVSIMGMDTTSFTIVENGCTRLEPRTKCAISVQFTPQKIGPLAAQLVAVGTSDASLAYLMGVGE